MNQIFLTYEDALAQGEEYKDIIEVLVTNPLEFMPASYICDFSSLKVTTLRYFKKEYHFRGNWSCIWILEGCEGIVDNMLKNCYGEQK